MQKMAADSIRKHEVKELKKKSEDNNDLSYIME